MAFALPRVKLEVPSRQLLFITRPLPRDDEDSPETYQVIAYAVRPVPEAVADVLERAEILDGMRGSRDGLGDFPDEYQQYARVLADELRDFANQALGVLMWRAGRIGGPVDLGGSTFDVRWQETAEGVDLVNKPFLKNHLRHGAFTFKLPWPLLAYMVKRSPDAPRDDDADAPRDDDAEALLQKDLHQPLYHDLLREACETCYSNPRSSLVMCVAAVETGVKTLITDLQPDTGWLLEHTASPPVVKMLRELVETLPARNTFEGKVLRPTKAVIKMINEAIDLRNRLVHGRETNVPRATLETLLEATGELLYLFDFYRGQIWARGLVTASTIGPAAAAGAASAGKSPSG